MSESYRLTEHYKASQQVAYYRRLFDALESYTPEWREAAEKLNFWQNKATFLWVMRLHTDKG